MKNIKFYLVITILVILCVFLFISYLRKPCKTLLETRIDTILVNNPSKEMVEVKVEVPKYYFRIEYDTLYKYKKIDTTEIIKEYFENFTAKYFYTDTIQDSMILAIVNDTISKNKIIDRTFNYKFKKYMLINKTVTVKPRENALYGGIFTGGSRNEFILGGQLLYKMNDNIIGANYDLINNNITVSYNRKIKF